MSTLIVPNAAIPTATEVLVIETPKPGVSVQQIMAVLPAEIRATVKLYLDGKIRQWYSRGDGKGVVFLVNATTEDEARALMDTLPLAKEHLIDTEYIPVGPLMPLKALLGPGRTHGDSVESNPARNVRLQVARRKCMLNEPRCSADVRCLLASFRQPTELPPVFPQDDQGALIGPRGTYATILFCKRDDEGALRALPLGR